MHNIVLFFLSFCHVLFFAMPASASEMPVKKPMSAEARVQTVKALQAINQNRWSYGRSLIAKTRDPVAAKLYYWLSFTRDYGNPKFIRLAQFVHQNPEWPGVSRLKPLIEEKMPDDLPAPDVVVWFDQHPPSSAKAMDRYIDALLSRGNADKAKQILTQWWVDTPLASNDQRNIFSKYRHLLDREAHKARFSRLLLSRQYTNARAMAKILGAGYPELAEARIALAEQKNGVDSLIKRVPASLQNDPGLLYERLRWRRLKNMDQAAIDMLDNMPPADRIPNLDDWWRERHIMIRRLIEKKDYRTAYRLASRHKQVDGFTLAQAEWLAGWLSLRFLNNPTKALQHFETLHAKVTTPISLARGSYWSGRATQALGRNDLSRKWFQEAAAYKTTFYGQLARAELGNSPDLPSATLPHLMPEQEQGFSSHELMQAALLLSEAGMREEAGEFLHAFVRHQDSPEASLFAAQTAGEIGLRHDAVRIAKAATKEGKFLTAHAFPVMADQLANVTTEWALVHSLIRQESLFDERAKSSAGALGLMQLMPATAKETARKLGVAHQTSWLTTRPDHNILLGSAYMNELLRRYDNFYPLAIAAYNAGPGRVSRWLDEFGDPRDAEIDLIDWIETIPIYETRNYVQRVMEGIYIYRLRLSGLQGSSQYDAAPIIAEPSRRAG